MGWPWLFVVASTGRSFRRKHVEWPFPLTASSPPTFWIASESSVSFSAILFSRFSLYRSQFSFSPKILYSKSDRNVAAEAHKKNLFGGHFVYMFSPREVAIFVAQTFATHPRDGIVVADALHLILLNKEHYVFGDSILFDGTGCYQHRNIGTETYLNSSLSAMVETLLR